MDKLVIKASQPLTGDVTISGAKNAALPLLMSALLADTCCYFGNVPDLRDINTSLALLQELGVKVKRPEKHQVELDASELNNFTASYDLVRTMHLSWY